MKAHAGYMARAIELANEAAAGGEVPIGAVVVDKAGVIIGEGHNRSIGSCDPTAHAEVVALRCAAKHVGNYRLDGCSLYVTLEPCPMCLGAIFHARIQTLFFGAWDPKGGACGSVVQLDQHHQLNPHCLVHGGLLQDQCSSLLSSYFQQLRQTHRESRPRLREDALRLDVSTLPHRMSCAHVHAFDDLEASQGLRVHVWSNHESACGPIDQLILCIPSIAHWAWQFDNLLSLPLPAGVQLWIVDLPGHGYSDKTKTGWEYDEVYRTSVVHALIARSGANSITLVAQGQSAMLAMKLARKANSAVHRVCLVDPVISPALALRDSAGRLPASIGQLHTRLAESSIRDANGSDSMLLAPYPNSGHVKGLFRWLNRSAASDTQTIPEEYAGERMVCPNSVFVHTSSSEKSVLEFLRFWSMTTPTSSWNDMLSNPWPFLLRGSATVGNKSN